MLDYNDIEFLFIGDLEADVEKENLNKFEDIDILKVGHHCSKSSSSFEFLEAIKPEIVVISTGLGNDYGHPHLEVLVRLGNFVENIYGTWKSVSIVITTDGTMYEVNTNETVSIGEQMTIDDGNEESAVGDGVNMLKWTESYMWNNDGDTGILYDNNGKELARY